MGYARSRNADIPGYPKPHFPGLSPKCTADDGSSVGAPRLGDRVVAQVTSYFRNPLPAAAPPNVCLRPEADTAWFERVRTRIYRPCHQQ